MKKTFFSLFDKIIDILNGFITVVISLAVLGFLWGIVKILFNSDNEVAKKEGRSFMLYGIITLFVMTSVWGLVNLLNGTIQVEDENYTGDVNTKKETVEDPAQDPKLNDVKDIFKNNNPQGAV